MANVDVSKARNSEVNWLRERRTCLATKTIENLMSIFKNILVKFM